MEKVSQKIPDALRLELETKIKQITRRDIELGLLNAAGERRESAEEKRGDPAKHEEKAILVSSEEESSPPDVIETLKPSPSVEAPVKEPEPLRVTPTQKAWLV